MDCKTARLLLELNRPTGAELDADEARALEEHLDRCLECSALARAERGFHQQVGLAMRQVAVPPELRGRLLSRLDKERGDYYRKQAARGIRTAVALAACFLIAIFVWRMRADKKPELKLEELHALIAENHCDAQSKEQVEEWFMDNYGISIVAPDDLDYALLLECGLVDCQGQKVPCLTFVRPERREMARVYIINDAQFDTRKLGNSSSIINGATKAEIYRPDRANFTYVILFNGENLQPFRTEQQRQAAG
jgi:hypothetical protein